MTLQLMSVSRPATAVMFLIARMLGGPGECGGKWREGAGGTMSQCHFVVGLFSLAWSLRLPLGKGGLSQLSAEARMGATHVTPRTHCCYREIVANRCEPHMAMSPIPSLDRNHQDWAR